MSGDAQREHPEAYLPGDRRLALARGSDIADRSHGAALFADISGFTPLTEALATEFGPRQGAEQLTATLETVFGAVLAQLHRRGGAAIYFSGDALTCWIDQDDGMLALDCALAMQDAMHGAGSVQLPSGVTVQMGIKITIAVGEARRFVVGDPDIQLIDVLAGSLIDELAAAESVTTQGEIVVTDATAHRIGARAEWGEQRTTPAGGSVRVARTLRATVVLPAEPAFDVALPISVTRQWLLPAVYERLRDGHGEFLAELRAAVPVFVSFTGIDFDEDDAAAAKLDTFIVATQRIVDGYGGSVLQLTIGDKGAYVYAVFGSPIAHEDDAARACAASLELLALASSTAAREISIGISSGITRSGTYGHRRRRTFCCLGDPVNLAARLMSKAPAGHTYIDAETFGNAGGGFAATRLQPLTVKGKAAPVEAYDLTGIRRRRQSLRGTADSPMVGRDQALAELRQAFQASQSGRGRVVGVTGEAGLGKTRLINELLADVPATTTVVTGDAQAFGVRTAYFAWRDVVHQLFDIAPDASADSQLLAFRTALDAVDPQLTPRAPLLGMITGTELPDSDITLAMDAKLRKGSLELLVAQFLNRRGRQVGPMVIVLEDCHWLDPLAGELLDVVARRVVDLPVLVVLSYRSVADTEAPPWLRVIRALGHAVEITLTELTGAAATAMLDAAIGQLYPDARLSDRARTILLERTEGNPFHLEQLAAFLHTTGVDPTDVDALAAVELPSSLQSLVLSRVDALAEQPRRTVKIASVIGRSFDVPAVHGVYPELGEVAALDDALHHLTRRDLVVPDEAIDAGYLFRHSVVREVAYDSLPFALRSTVHERVGAYLEAVLPASDSEHAQLDLLAYHYGHSDNLERKRHYLWRAGDAARESYASDTAIAHYQALLPLLGEDETGRVLTSLGQVHELVANWTSAHECYERAGALALSRGDVAGQAWSNAFLAEIARKQGDFAGSTALLDVAAQLFDVEHDDAGLGRVLHLQGTLAAQQQRLAEARDCYQRSLVLRRRLGDRSAESGLLANLGIIAEYEGDYQQAIALTEQALALRVELGDRWAIGHAHSNLGQLLLFTDDVERAIVSLTEALRLHREVGDLWMIAIDYNNLASAELRNDDLAGAARNFSFCVDAHRLVDDPWSAAHLLEDVAKLALRSPVARIALELAGAADTLRAAIGAPRTPTQQNDLDAVLASQYADLGDEADDVRGHGRQLTVDAAFEMANDVCESLTP